MPWLLRPNIHRRHPAIAAIAVFALSITVLRGSAAAEQAEQEPPPPTAEQKEAAGKAFERGEKAYTQGRFNDAGAAFEEAFHYVPHPAALWNAARAYKKGGNLARAANVYALYLEKAPPDAADRKGAQSDLDQLSKKLGRLEIFAPDASDLLIDDKPARAGIVYVNPGTHVISGIVGAKSLSRVQSVDAGATAHVALVAEDAAKPEQPGPSADTPPSASSAEPLNLRVLPPAAAYAGAGVTAGALALTIGFGINTLSARADFDTAPTQDKLDAGRSKQKITNVFLGTTIALGTLTGAAALFFTDWTGKNGRAVQAGLHPSGIVLRGKFE